MAAAKKDIYFLAVKVFLCKGGSLFICKDSFGHWDLPGGRIIASEFKTRLEKIVERKMKEELGLGLRYTLGKPVLFMRHERKESMPGGRKKARIFAIGYEAKYVGGEIKLSNRHTNCLWVPVKKLNPKKYFRGGWLHGVEEYLRLIRK